MPRKSRIDAAGAIHHVMRPLHNAPFCPITTSGSNFNPRNTQCIPVVKIIAFLVLEQNWTFFKGLVIARGINRAAIFSDDGGEHGGRTWPDTDRRTEIEF